MTTLVFCNYVLLHFYIFNSSMAKSTTKMPKLNSSALLSSDRGRFKNYSVLSRCDSFSSCSNDSSVYSGSNPIQTRYRNAKSNINHPVNVHKRSRNSSGSSISSNISCISDKDLKSGIISQASTKTEVNNCINNDIKAPHLNYSKINSDNKGLKEESTVNDKLDHSENSLVILPSRHNLRGKITKKRCTCCPSTCATVVLRHYKKYIKTEEKTVISSTKSEGKTVISSTRVKTYVQKNSPEAIQTNESSNVSSSKSKTRKRRSEIEKLYASLHEIEWAKNFSPDNILRQINVRQAASCSAFGRPSANTDSSPKKNSKKQKLISKANTASSSGIAESIESKIDMKHAKPNSCNIISNSNKEICTYTDCDNEQKVTDLQTAEITTSDIYHCKQSCNSHSSVNITSCSVSHIVKEININSLESMVTENGTDYSDDAHLSYTSDESSSAVSSSIVNLQSKHLLDLKYKNKKKRNLSDTDFSEYSTTPTFFDIAEEGIRTIDACFREVGAEVVVSTCYDQGGSLPLLTSVRENKVSNKVLDNPPVLEPCIEFDSKLKDELVENLDKQITIKTESAVERYSKLPVSALTKAKKYESKYYNSNSCNCQNNIGFLGFKKCHAFSKLHYKISRKIVKKYVRQSRSKAQLKYLSKYKTSASLNCKNVELQNKSNRHFIKIKKENRNSDNDQNSILLSSTSSKSGEISYNKPDKRANNVIFHQITDAKYSANKNADRIVFDCNKNSSFFHDTRKLLQYPDEIRKQSIISQTQSSSSQSQSRSISQQLVSTKVEKDEIRHKYPILRPTASFGISSEYKSIRVNRSYNFTHIILLVTRGKSMFLTLETLRELRDAVTRTNNDSGCQVLVINGVGDSFCLGLDLKPLVGPRKKIASTEIAVAVKELVEALSDFKKPLAAVVNGPALGLGMTLLNHADLTIASEKATFCMPYSYLGYMPEGGATLTLPQIVGSTVAMDLLLRGKTLTAREACNVGLISEVLEAKRLPHELVSRVRVLAQNSLCALETTKALLKMQLHVNLRLVLENEVKLLPRMWLTRTCQDSLRKALQSGILSE